MYKINCLVKSTLWFMSYEAIIIASNDYDTRLINETLWTTNRPRHTIWTYNYVIVSNKIDMSKIEHFRIIAGVLIVTAAFSIAGLIQGLEIVAFMLLGIVGLYFSFFFIKYVYEQKGYSLDQTEENLNE